MIQVDDVSEKIILFHNEAFPGGRNCMIWPKFGHKILLIEQHFRLWSCEHLNLKTNQRNKTTHKAFFLTKMEDLNLVHFQLLRTGTLISYCVLLAQSYRYNADEFATRSMTISTNKSIIPFSTQPNHY